MSDLPAAVVIGPYRVTITPDMGQASALDCDACISLGQQQMIVRPGYGYDYTAVSVFHEVLHGVFKIVGLQDLHEVEERIVDSLSAALLDTLRRNPALVAFLMDGVES